MIKEAHRYIIGLFNLVLKFVVDSPLSVTEQALLVRLLDFPLQNMIQAKCLVPRNSATETTLFVALDLSKATRMLPRTHVFPYRARPKIGLADRTGFRMKTRTIPFSLSLFLRVFHGRSQIMTYR